MTSTIEMSDDLQARFETHLDEAETDAALTEELVGLYETGGGVLREGYAEGPTGDHVPVRRRRGLG